MATKNTWIFGSSVKKYIFQTQRRKIINQTNFNGKCKSIRKKKIKLTNHSLQGILYNKIKNTFLIDFDDIFIPIPTFQP